MVFSIGIGATLQLANPVLHALTAGLRARSSIHGQRRQIVATHVTVQSCPVRIQLTLRRQSGFLQEGCQQSVVVVLQQHLYVQVACLLQRTVQQCDVTKWKLVGIEPILCLHAACHKEHRQRKGCSSNTYQMSSHNSRIVNLVAKLHIIFDILYYRVFKDC